MKFTYYYIIFINVLAVGALVAIDQLVELGEIQWAGISTNFPILAAMLLAGSTCTTTQEAMRTTTQHVYMLAYQTWPSMAFVGVLWGAEPFGQVTSIVLASAAVIIVLFVQYSMIKSEL
jgi:glucose uptake protein GlcU